jgi:hypothetical protein
MAKRPVPVHYLRSNESTWSPPAILCLDTETRSTVEDDNEVHTIRLWVARFTDRRAQLGCTPRDEYADGVTGEDLAHQIHSWMHYRKTVWVYAHNLHFDLCTTGLVGELIALGWQVTDFAVDSQTPFIRFERGGQHLTVCDSWSWLTHKLEDIGHAVGAVKPPLPSESDDPAVWLARCHADVTILSRAMLALMAWWDDNALGRWSITGGTAGWNVMRHIPTGRRILVDPDSAKVAADRLAIYGGRRGQWRAGKLPVGRYAELDLERAYTTVCKDFPLPCERMVSFDSLPVNHPWVTSDRYGIVAQVTLETDTARWPVRIDGRVWYPVGRYTTVLAGPEIAEAANLGALCAIGPGHMHRLGYALRPWALWCLTCQADTTGAVPEVAKMVLRHWGRAVIGKWAQRGFERIQLGAAPTRGWGFIDGWNHHAGVKASIVDFGGTRWQVSASGEADNAYPAILAFIESHVRVALGRAIDAIGFHSMAFCDTDGMIVNCSDPLLLGHAVRAAEPFLLREKRAYRHVEILGPQHAVLDGRRRFAGVPASAEALPDGQLGARLWPKLAWQMSHGRAGTYVRPHQCYRIGGTYAPGWVLVDGSVRPVEVRDGPDGCPAIVPWPQTALAASEGGLAAVQSPALEVHRGS